MNIVALPPEGGGGGSGATGIAIGVKVAREET